MYGYDADNNLTEELSYKSDKTLIRKSIYSYEFDNYKNWVRKTTEVDGKIVNIMERQYEYLK